MIRSDREAYPTRDLARAWTRAFDRVAEPELRLRAVLSLARTLANAERAIVFGADRVLAGVPGARDAVPVRRLFERTRGVLEDELVTPELYVARIAPERPERLALRWRDPGEETVEVARAVVASCAWALGLRVAERAPADLPDGGATLRRLEQLVHDARRMNRTFAVIYVDVEPPETAAGSGFAARDAVARGLRRQVRANDHLGHLGGDAYLALLALESGESEAYPAAQRLLSAAAAWDGSANVGVAICPDDGVQPEDLVEKAGAAAMAAASVGGARPYWYRESAGRELGERAIVRAQLCDGDPAALLEVCYQPVFDAQTGAPWAVSAVPAWRDPQADDAAEPRAFLAGEYGRAAREAVERWTIASAARAHRGWRAAGADLRVHLAPATLSDGVVDAVAEGFGSDDAMRGVLVEIAAGGEPPAVVASFARRLHALGARIGVAARHAASGAFEAAGGLLDFVTVDGSHDVRTLAELALASVVAPVVIASGVDGPEQGRWLARHGATALTGQGLAAPMGLPRLVRWASEQRGSLEL